MRGPFWRTNELAALRKHYPTGGTKAVMQYVNRSANAIKQAAKVHGVVIPPEVFKRMVGRKRKQ